MFSCLKVHWECMHSGCGSAGVRCRERGQERARLQAQVIAVTPETAALEALVLMARENIAGVGVVNNLSGALIGNFSFSDLRCARTP